jgi:hypothetical protein
MNDSEDSLLKSARLDRSVVEITTLTDQGDDGLYWADKTVEERMAALELMRQIVYGYDPATERLQRSFEVFKCEVS